MSRVVKMEWLPTSIVLVVFMIGYCAPQNADDILLITLEAIAEAQKKIVQRFDDLQTEVKMIKESQKTAEENFGRLEAKLDAVQGGLETKLDAVQAEQEIVRSASQQCFTSQEMTTFQDILEADECTQGIHNCSALATCSDSILHYKCHCNPGYSGDGFTCQDINECLEKPNVCDDSQLCVNHPGNYSCTCPEGFQKENEGNTCQDIDECLEKPNMCDDSQICVNHPGNYSCTCPAGFQKENEGNTCQDINECESGGHMCHRSATCTNTIGNYACECLPSYDGDGYTCNKVSKCSSPSKVISDLGCVIPVSTELTWNEAQENCIRKGGRLLEGIRREHLQPLHQHFYDYVGLYAHIGHRGGVYVMSRHPVSSHDVVWGGGEPTGSAQDKDDCGLLYLSGPSSYLMDYGCSNTDPSLCQIMY